MIYLVGIIITFFLVFILTSKKNKSKADLILTLWLSFTGLHLLFFYIHVTGKYVTFPYFLGLEIPMPLLHGPFLFLYTVALTDKEHNKKINTLHFIPFVLALLSILPFLALSFPQKIKVYQEEGKSYELLNSIIYIAIILSGIFYTIISLQKLDKHSKAIREQFSYTEKINLKWLAYLILGSSIIWLVVIFRVDEYVFSAVVLYVLFIGYFGIKQVGIFTISKPQVPDETSENLSIEVGNKLNDTKFDEKEIEVQSGKIKYEKSIISADDLSAIQNKLVVLMQTEKSYTDPELTLSDLAQKVNVHPNTLSQVINSVEQKNFYEFINHLRVEEFKKLIAIPHNQKFTLLSLAFESGYNSKTAFNRNFKKNTGHSPSDYLKQMNISLSKPI
jgi:AraC-like DNA-binding protein